MIVDLRSDDARLGVGAIERLGLRNAVLVPQRDADQNEKWNRGRGDEPEQLRAYSQTSNPVITPVGRGSSRSPDTAVRKEK